MSSNLTASATREKTYGNFYPYVFSVICRKFDRGIRTIEGGRGNDSFPVAGGNGVLATEGSPKRSFASSEIPTASAISIYYQ